MKNNFDQEIAYKPERYPTAKIKIPMIDILVIKVDITMSETYQNRKINNPIIMANEPLKASLI
tara:strand:- start:49 stop:237 length:189 start_codon:yes stop_codon:yes gene_type:complete